MLQTLGLWAQIPQSQSERSRDCRVGPCTDLNSVKDRHSAVAWRLPPTLLSFSFSLFFPSLSLSFFHSLLLYPLLSLPLSLPPFLSLRCNPCVRAAGPIRCWTLPTCLSSTQPRVVLFSLMDLHGSFSSSILCAGL